MGAAIGDILGLAVGVAISPIPIIAVILMLFSAKARSNSVSFVLGWLIGLLLAGGVVLAIGLEASEGGASDVSGWIKILIGVLFLFLAGKQWTGRPKADEESQMPAWMASIDDFTAAKSFGLAFLLAAINPKNLGLTVAAAAAISARGLSGGQEVAVLVVFALIASLTVAVPVVWFLVSGSSAEKQLNVMKDWLVANNNTVMAVLFVVLGAKVLGDGISIIA
jgi:hypothetical protein